ncbi:MAG: hypothetical protein ACHP7N_03115 [Caulobacterales bacterium]
MWMVVWRPLVIAFGAVGLAMSGVVSSAISQNPIASNVVMGFCLLILAIQAVLSIGVLIAGTWGPLHRWAVALSHPAHR